MDAAREVAEGKAMVDAAIEAKVGLFIFAGLPGTSRASGGKHTKVYACKSGPDTPRSAHHGFLTPLHSHVRLISRLQGRDRRLWPIQDHRHVQLPNRPSRILFRQIVRRRSFLPRTTRLDRRTPKSTDPAYRYPWRFRTLGQGGHRTERG
jgi:hypothetical protein